MGSLNLCLTRLRKVIDKQDADDIRAGYRDFIEDGMPSSEAAQRAVLDLIEQALGERAEIEAKIVKAGGQPTAPPPLPERFAPKASAVETQAPRKLPDGITVELSDTRLKGEEARLKGGEYKAIARRERPAGPYAVEDGYGNTPDEAIDNALRKFKITTESTGQTSLVPEATTGEKIKAAEKAKDEKGKAASDDAGPLFNPDAGKQGDLVDLAKAPVAVDGVTGADAASGALAGMSLADLEALQAKFRETRDRGVLPAGVVPMDLINEISTRKMKGEAEKPADTYTGPRNEWVERPGQRDMVLKLDGDGEVVGSVMFDATRQKRNRDEAWAALDADGKVIGYGPTMGDAKDIVDGKSAGQRAYEADVRARPKYDDGSDRKTWAQLGEVERGSWEKNPTQREPAKQPDSPKTDITRVSDLSKDQLIEVIKGIGRTPKKPETLAGMQQLLAQSVIEAGRDGAKVARISEIDGADVSEASVQKASEDAKARQIAKINEAIDKVLANAETTETVAGKADVEADSDPLAPLVVVLRGAGFKTIIEARKFVKELGILPADATNKQIDETVEAAVVAAARQIVKQYGDAGNSPKTIFEQLTRLYGNQPNLASRTGTSVANQAYSTPMPLAYVASRLAGVQAAAEVYEPTAGNGALLIEADPAKTTANEIDPDRAQALKKQGFAVTSKDGAEVPTLTDIDSVIMNPPFGAVKEGGASKVFELGDLTTTKIDHAISLNALEAMADDGKAVLIIGGTKAEDVKERTQSYRGLNMKDAKTGKGKDNFYRVLYDRYNVTDHFTVSGDLYTKQGASWPVDVIVIEGRGKSQRPLPGTPQGVPALLKSWDEIAEKIPNDTANDRAGDRPARKPVAPVGRPAAVDEVRGDEDVGTGADTGKPEAGAKPASVRADAPVGQPEGDRGDAVGQGDVPAGGRGDRGRIDRDRAPRRERVKVTEGASQAKYEPVSGSKSVDTLVPSSMADSSRNAMERVEQRHGNVDDFVQDALGYEADADGMFFIRTDPETGEKKKERPFSAEQIDAIASAIDNVERGDAMILGDATGIGKGRVGAGMLRYAIKKGLVPVLMTEKMDLYGDMYRDMRDIGLFEMLGREPRILTTDVGKSIPLDEEAVEWKADAELAEEAGEPLPKRRGKFLSGGSAPAKDKAYDRLMAGDTDVADVVFTTYSQMQTLGEGKAIPRRRSVLKAIAPRAMMVLDETHNAGGQGVVDDTRGKKAAEGGRAEFVRELAQTTKGLLFMSATYAKRPNVMDLYARTDMGKAVEDIKDLPKLIQRGGVPMQQIVASMLAESGQYLRRERSFEGIEYAVEEAKVDDAAYDKFVGSVQSIFQFDTKVEEARSEIVEEILAELGAGTKGNDSGVGEASARSTSFSSIMHNIVSQMLLAIKADAAADRAIAALKAGEKPVITLANTNESFISDFAEADGTSIGGALDIDFGDMLRRYLQRTLRVTYKKAGDKKPSHYQIPLERLPASLQKAYRDVEALIDAGNYAGMPVAPIDWIRHRITKAGYTVREVTGRKTMLDYGRKTPTLVARPKGETGSAGKRVTLAKFNGGTLDAVILNQSGSTGVSIHANRTFKDQRKRRMVLAQAEANIDTHMQMLGRINRTGQVILPAYSQLAAGIPAEVRPTAVLMKKMASLNANTTGARGSTFTAEAADFMNEVGDKVMAEYLWENPEINVALGEPYDGVEVKDVVQKATGKLVLLTVAQQREMLDTVQKNYAREIEQLDALGENPLEAKMLDLQAETLETVELKAKTGDSPFMEAVRIEKVTAKAQGRAMPISDIADKVAEALKITKPEGSEQAVIEQLEARGRGWRETESRRIQEVARKQMADELAETKAESREGVRSKALANISRWQQTMNVAYPGARVSLSMPSGDLDGIVMSVERSGKAKNIVALSAWTVKIAVPDSARQFEFPMSKLFPSGIAKSEDEKGATITRSSTFPAMLVQAFEEARKDGRETRYILTGNVLGGYDQTGGSGQIVNFTTKDGQVRPGVLMSRDFKVDKFMSTRAIRFRTADQVATFIDRVSDVEVTGRDAELVLGRNRNGYYIQMAKARGKAGKYYTDKAVRSAVAPTEFTARGNKMMAEDLSRDKFVAAVDEMRKIGAAFETNTAQDEAQAIVAGGVDRAIAATGRPDQRAIENIARFLKMGRTVSVPKDVVEGSLAEIRESLDLVPAGTAAGAVSKIAPAKKGSRYDAVATIVDTDGKEHSLPINWATLAETRAFTLTDGSLIGLFRLSSLTGGNRPGAVEGAGRTGIGVQTAESRGLIAHESIHARRRGGILRGSVWSTLVGHAGNLRILDKEYGTYLAEIGHPDANKYPGGVTIRELYEDIYRNEPDLQERMDQESVAIMVELIEHGALMPMEVAPVEAALKRVFRSAELGRSGRGRTDGGALFALDAYTGQSMRRSLDTSTDARKARAEEMGFDTSRVVYRGLGHPYDEAAVADRKWQMFTSSREVAGGYAGDRDGSNVVPVYLRRGKNLEVDAGRKRWDRIAGTAVPYQVKRDLAMPMDPVYSVGEIAKAALRGGYDSITVNNVIDNNDGTDATTSTVDVIFDPSNIRSVNAAFDPAQSDSPQIMASAVPPVLTSLDRSTQRNIEQALRDATEIVGRIAGPGATVDARAQIPIWSLNLGSDQLQRSSEVMGAAPETAGGFYRQMGDGKALIGLAFADPRHDLRTAAGHEAYHHVETVLASPQEMRLLRSPSEMERATRHAAAEIGYSIEETRKLPDYEIRAIAFQRYRRMREEGMTMTPLHIGIRRMWDAMVRLLQNVRNALRRQGFDSMESIFERARTGEMVAAAAERRIAATASPAPRVGLQRQMVPTGYVDREPFDLNQVREVRRYVGDVALADVRTVQGSIGVASTRAKLRNPASDGPVSLFKWGERYYVNDGNHRVEAARAKNASTIRAEVIELAPKEPTRGTPVMEGRGQADAAAQRVGARQNYQSAGALLSAIPPKTPGKGVTDAIHTIARRVANEDTAAASASDVGSFADQWLAREDGASSTATALYEAYLVWAGEAGADAVALPTFKRTLVDLNYLPQRMAGRDRYVGVVVRAVNTRPQATLSGAVSSPVAEANATEVSAEVAKGVSIWEAIRRVGARLMQKLGLKPEVASETEARLAHLDRMQVAIANDNSAAAAIHGNVVALPSTMASIFPTATSSGTFFGRRVAATMRRMAPRSDQWRVRLQDKFLMVRRQQEEIERQTGSELPLGLDVYTSESLFHGRAGERMADLMQKRVEPLVEHLRKNDIDADEFGDYLYARHAQERNAYIRGIDPANDAGSGMTDADAQAALARVASGPKAQAFSDAAAMIDQINKETRDTLLSSGLITRETYDSWSTDYQHYVPLRGWEANDEEQVFPRVGKGFNIRGPEAYKALGRRTKSDNPVAYVLLQAQQAIVRAEKNRVNKTLLRLVESHPDPDVWQVYRGENKRVLKTDPVTGQDYVATVFVPPQFSAHDPSIVGVKVGGKQHYIQVHNANLARALRGVGSSDLDHAIVRSMMAVTRFYAQLLTSWNPEFVVGNFFRDVQTALINSKDVADLPEGTRKKMLAEALSLKSIRGIYNALRGDGSAEHAQYFEEFRLAGGKISFMEYNDVERIKSRIEHLIGDGSWSKVMRAVRPLGKYVEDLNTSVENGVRLSTYISMRKAGISKERAASVARELTVNFNRKGEWGPVINSAYMFFNASVQGSTRMLQAIARSKAVRRTVYAIAFGGMAMEMLNYLIAGDDDDKENAYDKIKPWVKERNMIFMLPGRKDYLMIPMPYGYNVPFVAGQKVGELIRSTMGHGKLTPAKAAAGIMDAIMGSFNPLGTNPTTSFLQMMSPTILDPVVQVAENKTWFGGPIFPTKFDKNKPDSETYFSSVHPAFIEAAKWLNRQTGGNAAKSGFVDVSPEVLEHYTQFLGGGIAKFLLNATGTGQRALSGEEFIPEKTPILRRLYGTQTSASRRSDFYEAWTKVDAARYEVIQLNKAGDREGMNSARAENKAELEAYGAMKSTQKALSQYSKQRTQIQLNRSLTDAEKKTKLDEIKDKENKLILRALEVYSRAKKAADGK